MRTLPVLAATALFLSGSVAICAAKSPGASGQTPGHSMQSGGTTGGEPGASGYSPGDQMKDKGSLGTNPGASGYAPGHKKRHRG
jgi:hypothetical protein